MQEDALAQTSKLELEVAEFSFAQTNEWIKETHKRRRGCDLRTS